METYLSITITYSGNHRIEPEVMYYRDDARNHGFCTIDKLTVDEANRLMWELVKLGGKNTYTSNMFNPAISERKVTFYGKL